MLTKFGHVNHIINKNGKIYFDVNAYDFLLFDSGKNGIIARKTDDKIQVEYDSLLNKYPLPSYVLINNPNAFLIQPRQYSHNIWDT